jgi:hypothetical protein
LVRGINQIKKCQNNFLRCREFFHPVTVSDYPSKILLACLFVANVRRISETGITVEWPLAIAAPIKVFRKRHG